MILDPINISGSSPSEPKGFEGTPDWVYQAPTGVSVLSRELIEQRTPRNVSDLFRDMSGVSTAVDRQNPGLTVNIRGLQEQGRVNVMIDGARQNFQQAGHDANSFVYVDPELIGQVVVEKGPTSTVGGAGVIGGVVAMRTLEAEDILLPGRNYGSRSRITTETNQFRYTASEAVAARNEHFEFVGALSRKESGAYQPGTDGTLLFIGPGEPVLFTNQNNRSGLAKFTWRPTKEQMFKFGYVALDNAFSTGQGEYTDTNKLFTETATADYSWKPASQWIDFSAKAWWTTTDNHQYRPPRVLYGYFDLQYGLTSYGGSLSNTSRFDIPLFNVEWTNGVEYFKDTTKTGVITDQTNPSDAEWFSGPTPAGVRDVASAFSQIKVRQGEWLELIAGGRYDRYSLSGSGNFINACTEYAIECTQPFAVDTTEGRFSPQYTVAVTPVAGFQVYGKYAEGFRPPQIMETLQYGRHIGNGVVFGPNPNLLPETSKTFEAGANFKFDNIFVVGDGFRAKAAIFETKIDNFITTGTGRYPQAGTYADLVQTAFVRMNLLGPTTTIKGVELEASYDAGRMYVGGSYTRLKATYDGVFDPFFAGPPNGDAYLPFLRYWEREYFFIFIPPKEKYTMDGGLRFFDRKLTLGGRMTYVSPAAPITTADLLPTYQTNSYHLYDLYLSLAFNENLVARINVDNVLDKAYVDAMGVPTYPAPGRTVTFSLQGNF
ncbi:MAG: TonB-dependent hemoglobin/transferrin/lactoferrin family receptor [Pseudorhodoplanes sp.]|nr:TonB-dependent hemoglobin/transferrin/lactoferrin family receptor [Pseudorhodoplanes sp.]